MNIEKLVSKLVRASLDNNLREVRSISMRILRNLKETHPNIAKEISEALAENAIGASTQRSIGIQSSPMDTETLNSLVTIEEPNDYDMPIFSEIISNQLSNFISERMESKKLLEAGLTPPSSLLLYGPPGVGKTQIAKYLSGKLNLSLVTLDLSSVISSYLGKTGQNLKKVLDFAKSNPTILLLDEFDAVAKRRDDMSDLGELKRIVNVLLKELEEWPMETVLIAATNHPKLLDPAIWRRFDHTIEVTLPGKDERLTILENQFKNEEADFKTVLRVVSEMTDGFSGADICKIAERTKRRSVLHSQELSESIIQELSQFNGESSVEFNKLFCKLAKKHTKVSIRTLANWLDKSPSTIQYYLK